MLSSNDRHENPVNQNGLVWVTRGIAVILTALRALVTSEDMDFELRTPRAAAVPPKPLLKCDHNY